MHASQFLHVHQKPLKMKQNNSESTKTKSKPQLQKEVKNPLRILAIEFLGNILIITSGILPFIHVIIPDKPLEDKFFGYTSVHRFLYSAGTHASLLLLTIGIFIIISLLDKNNENIKTLTKHLRLCLLSPFISAVFFMSWVFIPNVNYNILAYSFFGVLIILISILVLLKIREYLKYLKQVYDYKELVLNEGLEYLGNKIQKSK